MSIIFKFCWLFLVARSACGFEDGGNYKIKSTSSSLMFELYNGIAGADTPIVAQMPLDSQVEAQSWRATDSGATPGYFYLRGKQAGTGLSRDWDLKDGALYHLEYAASPVQRWTFEGICNTGSGLIRNRAYNESCLQHNGANATITLENCDMGNGAMLWQLISV